MTNFKTKMIEVISVFLNDKNKQEIINNKNSFLSVLGVIFDELKGTKDIRMETKIIQKWNQSDLTKILKNLKKNKYEDPWKLKKSIMNKRNRKIYPILELSSSPNFY